MMRRAPMALLRAILTRASVRPGRHPFTQFPPGDTGVFTRVVLVLIDLWATRERAGVHGEVVRHISAQHARCVAGGGG